MKRHTALFAALALAGAVFAGQWVPLMPGQPERPAELEVLSSNSFRTVVELEVSGVYVDEVDAGGRTWQTIELGIEQGGLTLEEGAPQLPVVARFLKIPDDRGVAVEVLEREEVVLEGYKVYPAQAPQPEDGSAVPFTVDEKRYGTDAFYPVESQVVSDPMIMRDLRLVQLVLQPVRYNPVKGELRVARRLRIQLSYDRPGTVNVKHRKRRGVSRAFEPLYRELVANYDFGPPQDPRDGSYLIITHDDFASAVAPFAEWKHQKGWRTVVKTTSEIGGNDSATIRAYVADAYDNWPYPPDYVLLVGDAPTYLQCYYLSGQTHASDLPYSTHEGGDILADLMIGRVCCANLTEAQTAMNKLYRYEREPYMGNTDWYNKAACLAGYEGGPRFWSVCIRVRDYVMGRPFGQFDTLFERWNLNTKQGLMDTINQGRSWFMYRGHGMVNGWDNVSPDFLVSDVYALENYGMTPIIIGPTCLAGDFDNSQECLAEAWVKAGTPDSARGGMGYFGSSEVSYSGYNDSLAAGAWFSYTDSLLYTFGQCTQWGKLFMLEAYPLPDPTAEKEIWMFNNIGEPELNIWSDVPEVLTVNHPATVIIGQFPFAVEVTASDAPVENALVCVMSRQDSTIYHVGYTDGAGQVQFTIEATLPADSVLVTVTGRNRHPYLGHAMTISPNSAYVTHLRNTASDSAGGNNDGVINPGETIDLSIWVKNWGSLDADSVSGTLRTGDSSIALVDSADYFGTVAAGDSAFVEDGYRFDVGSGCGNGYVLRFNLACEDANDSVWVSGLNLVVGTPVLQFVSFEVDDRPPGGNGDGKIDPGETAELEVVLRNGGLGHAYSVSGILVSGDSLFVVSDSTGTFGDILSDSSGSNSGDRFTVTADAMMSVETPVACTLRVMSDGYEQLLAFTIVVGEIRAVDPVPDSGGVVPLYWAYDDCDSAYDEAPEFEWVDIAGIGTRLDLSDDQTVQVNLPSAFGPFVFYGRSYTQISICGNGWVGPGYTTSRTYTEHPLPSGSDPTILALVWDDLYPPTSNDVWWYHDADNHRFIVQWDSMPYYSSRTTFDWFQVVVYDTTMAARDGNSEFVYQYLTASGLNSCGVGTNDSIDVIGIQCLLDGRYHRGSAEIEPGRAIKYSTDAPRTGIAERPADAAGIGRARFLVWPNPVQSLAHVRFGVRREAGVKLAVFDLSGREVRHLIESSLKPGDYNVSWDRRDDTGRTLAAGVYFLKLEADGEKLVNKAILTD